jgi:hypothetical protein
VKLSCVAAGLLRLSPEEEAEAEELWALVSTNCPDCCPANVTKRPAMANNRPGMTVVIQPISAVVGDSLCRWHWLTIPPEFLPADALADCVGAGWRMRTAMMMTTTWTTTTTWKMTTTNGRNE